MPLLYTLTEWLRDPGSANLPLTYRYIVNNNKKNKQQTNKERLGFFSFSLLAHRVNVPTFVVTVNTKKVLQFVSGHVMVECLSKSKQ